VCLECSGRHRGLGTHVTFVRSVLMDVWSKRDLKRMQLGGNHNAREFFHSHGWRGNLSSIAIGEKYQSRIAQLYKAHLENLVDSDATLWSTPSDSDSMGRFVKEMSDMVDSLSPRAAVVRDQEGELTPMPMEPSLAQINSANVVPVTTATHTTTRIHQSGSGSVVGIGSRASGAGRSKKSLLGAKRGSAAEAAKVSVAVDWSKSGSDVPPETKTPAPVSKAPHPGVMPEPVRPVPTSIEERYKNARGISSADLFPNPAQAIGDPGPSRVDEFQVFSAQNNSQSTSSLGISDAINEASRAFNDFLNKGYN